MKRILSIIFLVGLYGCREPISDYQKGIDDTLICAWSQRYEACFCSAFYKSHFAVLTWAPDKVCGK